MKEQCLTSDLATQLNGKQRQIWELLDPNHFSTQGMTALHISVLLGASYPETLYTLKQMELQRLVRRTLKETNGAIATHWQRVQP